MIHLLVRYKWFSSVCAVVVVQGGGGAGKS